MAERDMRKDLPEINRRTFLRGAAGVLAGAALVAANPLSVFAADTYGETPGPDDLQPQIQPDPKSEALQTTEHIYRPGEVVHRGDRSQKRMFLTIDDGGSLERVQHAASLAAAEGVRLTFFPTGLNIAKGKDAWVQVLKKGHDIENHTWNHQNLMGLTGSQVRDEMVRQRDTVREVAQLAGISNYPQVFLRPPYGAGAGDSDVVSVCKDLGYVMALWSSDPQGWRDSVDESLIYQRFVRDFSNGLIMLMHTNTKDMDTLPRVIREAKRQGYALDKTLRDGVKTTVYPHQTQALQSPWSPGKSFPV